MHKHNSPRQTLSLMDAVNNSSETSLKANLWEEYSSFHDSFAEQLAYESSRKSHSDIWHLHYI